jgi:UDP-GlcNAc:undecaprenyl-phosphate/decaprenyl-phosphate GlcNAc-1-phosphate transferase
VLLIAVCTGAAAMGFLAYNFPHARMFCGDAGAYLLGFVTAVLLVLLMNQHIASPWFGLAVVIHPVTETLYSAWRRAKNGVHAMLPDTKHMHSLWVNHLREANHPVRLGYNAGAAWRTLALAAVPIVLAAAMPQNKWALQAICLGYVLAFVCAVRRLERRIEQRDSVMVSQPPFAENCK